MTGVVDELREAARGFLAALDAGQRAAAAWPWPSDEERERWFFTPTDHGGLPLAAMGPAQQRAAFRLLAAGLSPAGYATTCAIIGLENGLDGVEGFTATFGTRERGRDPGLYYVRVFGDPGGDTWACRVGGHHVSLHWTVVGGELVATTPSFLGADPAASPLVGGHLLRPLGALEDLARELVAELGEAAVVSPDAPWEIVTGNRTAIAEGDVPPQPWEIFREERPRREPEPVDERMRLSRVPLGVPLAGAPDLAAALVGAYLEHLPAAARPVIDAGGMHFAWAGSTRRGDPHYYRLQDDDWLIEYDNTKRDANHVHVVVRRWTADFGRDVLGDHLVRHHRGPADPA